MGVRSPGDVLNLGVSVPLSAPLWWPFLGSMRPLCHQSPGASPLPHSAGVVVMGQQHGQPLGGRAKGHPPACPATARNGSGETEVLGPFMWVLLAFNLLAKLYSSQMYKMRGLIKASQPALMESWRRQKILQFCLSPPCSLGDVLALAGAPCTPWYWRAQALPCC